METRETKSGIQWPSVVSRVQEANLIGNGRSGGGPITQSRTSCKPCSVAEYELTDESCLILFGDLESQRTNGMFREVGEVQSFAGLV